MFKGATQKIMNFMVLCCFVFTNTAWGYQGRETGKNLAVEMATQRRPITAEGKRVRSEIFREASLSGSILSIAEYLLTDHKDSSSIEYLEAVMRSEIKDHLTGIDVSRVKKQNDSVYIPYRYKGRDYVIAVTLRGTPASDEMNGVLLDISEKYEVTVTAKERPLFKYGNISEGPMLIAHRITELKDVGRAIKSGKGMIELDVQLTADNVPVVYWGNLDLPEGHKKYMREYTLRELEEQVTGKISRVEDILKKAEGHIAVQFDIKDWGEQVDPSYGDNVLKVLDSLVRKYDMSDDIYVATFNWEYIKKFKKVNPSICGGISLPAGVTRQKEVVSNLEEMIKFAKSSNIEAIALYPEQLSDVIIDRVHEEGLKLVINAGEDIDPEMFMKADMVYVEKKDFDKKYPRVINGRDLLKMEDEEILDLIKPEYGELKKHAAADWKYAKVIAESMGIGIESQEMNMLRVICLGHDIGGVLGYSHDERIEQDLMHEAKKKQISFAERDIKKIIDDFAANGIDLEEEYRDFVRTMDHGSNSVKVMTEKGIFIPADVKSLIVKHMGSPDDSEEWSEKEKLLFSIFVIADVFECGNSYYKQAGGYYKHAGKFETPEETLHFLKYIKFKSKGDISFEYMDNALDAVTRLIDSDDTGFKECIDYSRTPIEDTDINTPDILPVDRFEDDVNSRRAETILETNKAAEYLDSADTDLESYKDLDAMVSSVKLQNAVDSVLGLVGEMDGEDMPGEIRRSADILWQDRRFIMTDSIITSLIVLGRKAKARGEELIIGLGTDWIPGYKKRSLQHSAINPIIKELLTLGSTLKRMGLDNVRLIYSEEKELSRKVMEEAEDSGTSFKNVVILASEKSIVSSSFDPLRSTAYEEKAFLAGIDPGMLEKKKAPEGKVNYIDIIKMLSIALELARGKTVGGVPVIKQYMPLIRTVIFMPRSEPVDYEDIKRIRDNYLYALRSA